MKITEAYLVAPRKVELFETNLEEKLKGDQLLIEVRSCGICSSEFPVFKGEDSVIVGASAGISAIFIGIASHMPNYQLKFRFIGFIKLWHLAGIWILIDVVGLISNNAGGHFSHLGGALFGLLYLNSSSKKNQNISNWFSTLYKVRNNPLKTVYKSGKKKEPKTTNTSLNQKQINTILDKISKSGYDTLSKVEKDFLFKQGKR